MAFLDEYIRVSDDRPCPVCEKCDGCCVHRNGRQCICVRTPSKQTGNYVGWMHRVDVQPVAKPSKGRVYLSVRQVEEAIQYYQDDEEVLAIAAQSLKLPVQSLQAMGALYSTAKMAIVFPMKRHDGRICGARFRRRNGKKWSLKGGREGVFVSVGFDPTRPVFVVEGPTDAAALWAAGLTNVIGRPNCSGGVSIIRRLVGDVPVVVLADPEEAGQNGATQLASSMPNPCIVLSGPSDVRDFVTSFPLHSDAGAAIVQSLGLFSRLPWETIFRNTAGKFFDFSQLRYSPCPC